MPKRHALKEPLAIPAVFVFAAAELKAQNRLLSE
jgi:hypothetical protein